ncbi:hypothetical protein A9Q81_05405 [Gammaproteobacteria bacterium 42_54_T18]|nr:hypothetical protein A9Q81_05405 [Gammaproteobacteria bacterium 42_54_T18]
MNTENPHRYQQVPQGSYQPAVHYIQDDEIDLLDLFRTLVRRWKTIVVITVLCTAVAIAIALLTPPVFKATTYLLPPLKKDIQTFSQISGGSVSAGSIYTDFVRNANSLSIKRAFFEQESLGAYFRGGNASEPLTESEIYALFERFLGILSIGADKKNSELLSISMEWGSADGAANLVNKYVDFVAQITLDQAIVNFENARSTKLISINIDIAAKRKTAEQKRLRRIVQLQEALAIAKTLNIVNPLDSTSNGQPVAKGVLFEVSSGPQYYRGSRALNAEIHTLSSRVDDDAFIGELSGLQESIERLKLIVLDEASLNAIRVDSPAIPPLSRVKPKRSLIVVLGGILGVMLGVMTALFFAFVASQKKGSDKKLNAEATESELKEYQLLMQQTQGNGMPVTERRRSEDRRAMEQAEKEMS